MIKRSLVLTFASTLRPLQHFSRSFFSSHVLTTTSTASYIDYGRQKRFMGGYIEDAQLSSLGLEIYQEIYGLDKYPAVTFVIPREDDNWPVHLWGYKLGEGVEQHIARFLHPKLCPSSPLNSAVVPSNSPIRKKSEVGGR